MVMAGEEVKCDDSTDSRRVIWLNSSAKLSNGGVSLDDDAEGWQVHFILRNL